MTLNQTWKYRLTPFLLLAIISIASMRSLLQAQGLSLDDAANLNNSKYQVEKVLQVYFMQNATYPKTLDEGLQGVPGMKFDPWGKPYHYLFPGKHNPNKYDLWSGGPDGTAEFGNWPGSEPTGNGPSIPTYNYQQFTTVPSNSTGERNDQQASSYQPATTKSNFYNTAHLKKGELVYHPSDKMPRDVIGIHVSGKFVVKSAVSDGLVLVPAVDDNNPFARQFIVTNINTGVSPGQVGVVESRTVTIPKSKALEIVGRGMIPGTYKVTAPDPNF
jgi:hypothetical protein